MQPGDTAVIVSYRGNVAAGARPGADGDAARLQVSRHVPEVNLHRPRGLRQAAAAQHRAQSDLCSDNEFLRRVSIDTIGSLPTPKEVREFLADTRPDKRARKIDELLANPRHAALWATKFCDITGNNTDLLENPQQRRPKLSQMWHDWFRKRVAENMPYDEIVHGVLCATSRDGLSPEDYIKQYTELEADADKGWTNTYADKPTLDLFWRRQQTVTVDQWGEKTAAAFLGVRVECAQCHKHPFDRWTQVDYRAYANIFAAVNFGVSPEAKKVVRRGERRAQEERQRPEEPDCTDPRSLRRRRAPAARAAAAARCRTPTPTSRWRPRRWAGPEIAVKAGEDPRQALFDWMRRAGQPVLRPQLRQPRLGPLLRRRHRRSGGQLLAGQPAVQPEAARRPGQGLRRQQVRHPPAGAHHPELAHLPAELRRQRRPTGSTASTTRTAYLRPMMAEVVVDVLDDAVGVKEKFGNRRRRRTAGPSRSAPAGCKARQALAFRVFGRPPRASHLRLRAGVGPGPAAEAVPDGRRHAVRPRSTSRTTASSSCWPTTRTTTRRWTSCSWPRCRRLPTDKEREKFAAYRESHKDRRAAFADALWALVNTSEFHLESLTYAAIRAGCSNPRSRASELTASASAALTGGRTLGGTSGRKRVIHHGNAFPDGLRRVPSPRLPQDRRGRPVRPDAAPAAAPGEPGAGRGNRRAARSAAPTPSSCSGWPAAPPPSTCGTSSRTPRPRSAASSSRSPPTSTASRSASTCRRWPRSATSCTLVRSLNHTIPAHGPATVFMQTGNKPTPAVQYPVLGSLTTRLLPQEQGVPPFVSFGEMRNGNAAGYLGTAYNPFVIEGDGGKGGNDKANFRVRGIRCPPASRWTSWKTATGCSTTSTAPSAPPTRPATWWTASTPSTRRPWRSCAPTRPRRRST